jgi:hypothetical protein
VENNKEVKEKRKVQILFKSGRSVDLLVEELEVQSTGDGINNFRWVNAEPTIMFISLADIEAIFELPKE